MATSKKATAKKAPADVATTPKAGLTMPSYNIDLGANKAMTQRNELFMKLDDGINILRVLPQFDGSPTLFVKSVLHYVIRSEDNTRNIAPGCLEFHGAGNCYLCKLADWLKASGSKHLQDIGEKLTATAKLDMQVLVYDKATKTWLGPRIVTVPKGVAGSLSNMLSVAADTGTPFFCDPEKGQSIAITKTGKGMGTKYEVQPTGKFERVSDIMPGWESKVIMDLTKKLDVRVLNYEQQMVGAANTWVDFPWEQIHREIS